MVCGMGGVGDDTDAGVATAATRAAISAAKRELRRDIGDSSAVGEEIVGWKYAE